MLGEPGEARTVDVGEVAFDLHHLRTLQAFFLDAVDRVEVEFFGDGPVGGERQPDEDGDDGALVQTCGGTSLEQPSSRSTTLSEVILALKAEHQPRTHII